MEPTRFDRLTKGLVGVRSRRDLLRLLAAGSGLGLGAHLTRRLDADAADCKRLNESCATVPCCGGLRCNDLIPGVSGVCGAPKPIVGAGCVGVGESGAACCSNCCVRGTCTPTTEGAACCVNAGTACEANHECCSGCCVHRAESQTPGGKCGITPDPDNVLEECSKVP
jgi:hypothetical protein